MLIDGRILASLPSHMLSVDLSAAPSLVHTKEARLNRPFVLWNDVEGSLPHNGQL